MLKKLSIKCWMFLEKSFVGEKYPNIWIWIEKSICEFWINSLQNYKHLVTFYQIGMYFMHYNSYIIFGNHPLNGTW